MYSAEFEYYRPATLSEALELMRAHPDAKLLAGGHSLLPAMKLRLARPTALIDIGRLKELKGVEEQGDVLTIGALTTHATVAGSPAVRNRSPLLAEAAAQIGDVQVRNRGTLGGSLAHADPGADLPTAILALEAVIGADNVAGASVEYQAQEFFTGLFTTALRADDLLTRVRVPVQVAGQGAAYLKHKHPASGYAVIGVAAIIGMQDGRCTQARLAIGGATANPVRVSAAEELLTSETPGDAALDAAAARVAAALGDDLLADPYASADYRRHLATIMARRALAQAATRAMAGETVPA